MSVELASLEVSAGHAPGQAGRTRLQQQEKAFDSWSRTRRRACSEHEFQSDLNLPRIESGAREHAEVGGSQLSPRLTEDRTIGQVENLDARLEILRTQREPLVG